MMQYGNDRINSMETELQANVSAGTDSLEDCGSFEIREPLTWRLSQDGVLEISGLGRVPDFSCGRNPSPPWEDKKHLIRELVVREGIDEIGIRAFEGCESLQIVRLPETLCRIGAFAFFGCKMLEEISIPECVRLRYIYEEASDLEEEETLVFGIQAFYQTPWAVRTWGKHYIRGGLLHACFTGDDHPKIPVSVHTIGKFAFAYTDIQTLVLPDSVKEIRDYAFSFSHLKSISIPESVVQIGDYAFSGTELTRVGFPESWSKVRRVLIDQLLQRSSDADPDDPVLLPSLNEVALRSDKRYAPFRKIIVRERKPRADRKKVRTSSQCIYGTRALLPGVSLQRRIRRGSILIGIGYDETQVQFVTSYSWNRLHKLVEIYRLYPCIDDEGNVAAWKDTESFSWYGCIDGFFEWVYGPSTDRDNYLYSFYAGKYQEWFWSDGKGFYSGHYYGGSLEIDLLEYWRKQHPDMHIPSEQECDDRDRAEKERRTAAGGYFLV